MESEQGAEVISGHTYEDLGSRVVGNVGSSWLENLGWASVLRGEHAWELAEGESSVSVVVVSLKNEVCFFSGNVDSVAIEGVLDVDKSDWAVVCGVEDFEGVIEVEVCS